MLGFAGSWSGALVDAACYASRQGNVNPHEAHPASTDKNGDIRSCSPNAKTKSFSVVQQDRMTFNLDSDGNEKVHQLLLNAGKNSTYGVNLTGAMTQKVVKVETISLAK